MVSDLALLDGSLLSFMKSDFPRLKSKAHKNCESVQLILLSIISNLVNLLLCSGFKLAFISSFGQIRLVTFGSYCLAYFYQW